MIRKLCAWMMVMVMALSFQSINGSVFASNSQNAGPSLAYNVTDNNYLMVYSSDTGDGTYEILGQFLNSAGAVDGDSFQISDQADADTSAPEIIYNDELEQFFVVWQDGRGSTHQVMASILNADGSVLYDDFMIKSDSSVYQLTPQIARNPSSDATLVLWLEADKVSDTTYELIGAYIDESDLSSTELDFTKKADVISFDVTYDSTANEFVVVYDTQLSKRTRLNVKYVDSNGEIQDGTTFISPGDGEVTSPSVTYSQTADQNLIVWVDEDDSIDDVYTKYTTVSGTAIKVFSADENTEITDISITSKGDSDELLLVWTEFDGTDYSVIGNFVNDDGTSTGEENIVIVESSSEPVDTIIAFNPTDDNFLVMQDDGSGEPVQTDIGVIGETSFGELEFASLASTVTESGSIEVLVERKNGSTGEVTVNYSTSYGTADSDDFIEKSGTLTFVEGDIEESISILIIEDSSYEDDEYFDITLSSATGGAGIGATDNHTVTILNNDDPHGEFNFASTSKTVLEGGTISLLVERDLGQNGAVSVDYSINLGTASSSDVDTLGGTLSFADGVSSKEIIIDTTEDTETEEDETFEVVLGSPTGGSTMGSSDTATVTIIDDDQKTDSIGFADSQKTVSEGESVSLTLLRTGELNDQVTVDYATSTGTAGSSDFTSVSGAMTFEAGESQQTISIDTTEDTNLESTETFSVELTNPTGSGYLGEITSARVSIQDDDSEVSFASSTGSVLEGQVYTATVTRSGDTSTSGMVDYIVSGITTSNGDIVLDIDTLTFAAGDSTKTLSVTVNEDNEVESDETFKIALSNPTGNIVLGSIDTKTVTITDNDTESETFNFNSSSSEIMEGDTASVTVVRSGSMNGTSTVDYSISYDTATSDDVVFTEGTLSFADSEATKTIEITAVDDSVLEDEETLEITLSSPSGSSALGDLKSHSVAIVDNDSEIEFASSQKSVIEGGSATLTVLRSGYLGQATTIDYSMTEGSATTSDYTNDSGTLSFSAGVSKQTLTVATTEDSETEATESFAVTLANPSGASVLGTTSEMTISVIDDDQITDAMTFTSDADSVEEGESITIDVFRSGALTGEMTIDYATATGTAGTSDFTSGMGTLTFADGDNTESIVIETSEDTDIENSETFTVTIGNPSGGAEVGTIDVITVTISDDDRQIEFASETGTVIEGQTYTVTVVRTGDITNVDTVDYSTATDTAGTGDFASVSGTLTFSSGQASKSIQISTIDDTAVEDTEAFDLTLSNPSTGTQLGSQVSHTVSILENDVNIDTFNFAVSSSEITEGETAIVTIYRSGSLEGEVSVDYTVVQDTADSTDYSITSGTVTFADGESTKTIDVVITEDADIESAESFSIQLENPTGLSKVGSVNTVEVTIEDDDSQIDLSSTEHTIVEGEEIVITLTRTGSLTEASSVDYALVTDTADTEDFTEASGTVTFEPGESVKTIVISTTDDEIIESSESFTVVLSNPTGEATLGDTDEASIAISDNDVISTTFNFTSGSDNMVEGETEQFSVVRTGSTSGTATVAYSIVSGTAGTSDYVVAAGVLEFAEGEVLKSISIESIEDTEVEDVETFTLQLVNPSSNAQIGSVNETEVFIIDDDENFVEVSFEEGIETVSEGENLSLTVTRTGEILEEATIEYIVTTGTATSDDYETTSGTVEFGADEERATIEIPIVLDSDEESDEYFYVLLHNPSEGLTVGSVATVIVIVENRKPVVEVIEKDDDLVVTASNKDDIESAEVISSLSKVLIDKAVMDEIVSAQTIEAYYSHIDNTIESIEDEDVLRQVVDNYVDAVDALGNVEEENTESGWFEAQLIERIHTFSEAVTKVEDHEDLTSQFLEAIRKIQEENEIESSSAVDEAIENMAEVTFADIGSIDKNHRASVVEGTVEYTFDAAALELNIIEEYEAFNTLNTLVDSYYGDDNVRDFDFNVTLELPKVSDNITIKLDSDTLQAVDNHDAASLAIEVGGTSVIFDHTVFKNGGDTFGDVEVHLEYHSEENGTIDGTLRSNAGYSDEGYTVDVTVQMDGVIIDRFEKPLKLKFDVDEFMFEHEDYNPNKLSVFRLNEETGEWEPVGGWYDPITDSISVFRQNLSQYTVMQSNKTFTDIENSWAKDDIEELLGKGIIDETASFNPEESITREELATWVARSYGLEGEGDMPFEDISPDNENYNELAAAYSAGVFSGTGENTFNPEGFVTKEEMAVMLANAMTEFDQKKINENLGGELAQYSDSDLIDDWASDELAMLSELGFIDGEDGNMNPDQQLSKEEAANLLKKIYG